jgi:hypothetical protein
VHEPALPASEAVPSADPEPATAPAASGDDLTVLLHAWRDIVSDLARRPALKQLIEASRPVSIEGTVVTLGFPEEQGFLRDHAEKRKSAFEAAIAQRLGHPVGVRCVVTNLSLVPPLPADEEAAHILAEAHRIFADDRLDVPDVS